MPAFPSAIQTPRLLLREWRVSDAADLNHAIAANLDHLREWLDWAKHEPVSLEQKTNWIRQRGEQFKADQTYSYGIFDHGRGELIGSVGAHRRIGAGAIEIGYWIVRDRIGCGIATEAAGAITRAAFDLARVVRVEIHCDPANIASAAIPRKLGFQGPLLISKCVRSPEHALRDDAVWVLTSAMYPSSHAAHAIYTVLDDSTALG